MATSRSRSAAAKKAAPAKKSAPAKKATASKKSATPTKAAASKKTAAPKKAAAPAKKAAAPKKATATKGTASKAGAARSGAAPKKAVAAKKSAPASRATAAKKAAAPRNAAPAKKAAAPKKAAPARNAAPASRATAARKSAAPARAAGKKTRGLNPQNDLELILQDLLKDIYYAEKKLLRALGKMARNATHAELREAFTTHQSQTEDQVAKLEQAFSLMGLSPKAKKCAAMDGLLEEADEHISEYHRGAGLDAAMIIGAQKVEHYEIAAYGSMRSIARSLGLNEAADIFEAIREQESDTDELLTNLAERIVNPDAENSNEDAEASSGASGGAAGSGYESGSGVYSTDAGNYDSAAGEDSSSAVTGSRSSNGRSEDGSYYENVEAVEADIENDGTGRGAISSLTDGNNRGEASETGEAMGY